MLSKKQHLLNEKDKILLYKNRKFDKNKEIVMRRVLYYMAIIWYKVENILLKLIPSKEENTIVLLRTDNIGDFLLWTDSAKEFRKRFKDKKIVLICNTSTCTIAKMLPYWDEIIGVREQKMLFNPIYRLRLFISLSRRKFQTIYNCVYSHNYFVMDTIVNSLKANEKIGYDGDYTNIKNILKGFRFSANKMERIKEKLSQKTKTYYTQMVKGKEEILMELSRNADFIRGTIDKDFLSSLPRIEIKTTGKDFGLKENEYMVLFIGSSSLHRAWNREKYALLIDSVKEKVVICGGRSDERVLSEILPLVHREVVDLVGKTSMMDLFSVIKNAKYIVTNDTSAGHIAPIVRTKSVVLLPGNYPGRFHPYKVENLTDKDKDYLPKAIYHSMDCFNCANYCKYVHDQKTIWPCIDKIQVEDVLKEIEEMVF